MIKDFMCNNSIKLNTESRKNILFEYLGETGYLSLCRIINDISFEIEKFYTILV